MTREPTHIDERRADPRTRLTLKVEYPSAKGFLHDYTVNLSRGGTMLRTGRELHPGDPVLLELSFPGLVDPLALAGEVRWVKAEEDGEHTVGVIFDLQDAHVRETLEALVGRVRSEDPSLLARAVRILVVEDNPYVARLINEGLAGYEQRSAARTSFITEHARDGKEALARLVNERWDLLIVDMYLPVMDGETVIRTVRKDPRWKGLPVIAVSAGAQEARQVALAAGADFFLDKPFRLTDVLATLHKLVAAAGRKTEAAGTKPSRAPTEPR